MLPKITLSLSVAALLTACGTTSVPLPEGAIGAGGDPDKLLVVDCLLPGQIRKLGSKLTYLSPRRPVKTTVADCEIRGGEYVAYDRANYTTALAVWLPQAKEGDATAQVYVGEIYEKGMGTAPNFAEAAKWYRRAAEQGDSRAQVNLGRLYEQGLGVSQNKTEALNWYRRASGLTDDQLAFTTSIQELEQEAASLRQEVAETRQESASLRRQLAAAQRQLDQRVQNINELRRELDRTRREIRERSTAPGASPDSAEVRELQRKLLSQQQELAQRSQELTRLQRATNEQRARLGMELVTLQQQWQQDTEAAEAEQQQLRRELALREQEIQRLNRQFSSIQQQMQGRQEQLDQTEQDLEQTRRALESERSTDEQADSTRLQTLEAQLAQQEAAAQRLREERRALEQQAETQIAQLNAELKAARNRQTELEEDVRFQALERDSLQQQVAYQQRQLQTYRDEIQQKSAEQQRLRAELQRQRENATAGNQELIRQLEAELARTEQELGSARGQVSELENQLEQREAQVEQFQTSRQQASLAGPRIEILDPPLAQTRSAATAPSVTMRSATPSREIVGKVTAPAGLLSLTVNDQRQEVDSNGLFRASVELPAEENPVSVTAVDRRGQLSAINFTLVARFRSPILASDDTPAEQPVQPLPDVDFGRYYALVIGNNSYSSFPNLKTAVNDAQAVAGILRERYGFETKVLVDADRYQILSALNEYRASLTDKDNFLLYYAGHGELDQANQRGHWLPVNAEPGSTANWISNVQITDILNAMTAKHIMVIADSCYSGTLARSVTTSTEGGRSTEKQKKWLELMTQVRSRTVLTSGGLAPVLDSGGGSHSVFAKNLLNVLERNRRLLEGPELYQMVASQVKREAARFNVEQDPQYAPIAYAGDLGAPFFFTPVN